MIQNVHIIFMYLKDKIYYYVPTGKKIVFYFSYRMGETWKPSFASNFFELFY